MPPSFDVNGMERIKQWLLYRPPPRYPFADRHDAGAPPVAPIYQKTCASCHDPAGEHFGTVTPQDKVGTDPERMPGVRQSQWRRG